MLTKNEKQLLCYMLDKGATLRILSALDLELSFNTLIIPTRLTFGIAYCQEVKEVQEIFTDFYCDSSEETAQLYETFKGLLKKEYLFQDETFNSNGSKQYLIAYKAYKLKLPEIKFPFWKVNEYEDKFKDNPPETFLTNEDVFLRNYAKFKIRKSRNK